MNIALGADHAGYHLKEHLKTYLEKNGHIVTDCGTDSTESTDYPDYAVSACTLVKDGKCEIGILVCGSGIGVSITANKVSGIRAANCFEPEHAKLSRQHNNCNVLTLGARFTDNSKAEEIVDVFISTEFEGGRHQKRVDKIHSLTLC